MRNSLTFSHVNSRNTGRDKEKGQEENEGIPDSTQRSHLTIPSRFDAAGGCSRHVVSPTLCPFSTFRTVLALPNTHTHTHPYKPANSLILVVPAFSSSILTSLYRSGHVSLDVGSDPPNLESTVAGLCLPLL